MYRIRNPMVYKRLDETFTWQISSRKQVETTQELNNKKTQGKAILKKDSAMAGTDNKVFLVLRILAANPEFLTCCILSSNFKTHFRHHYLVVL